MEEPRWTFQFPWSEDQTKFKRDELFNADALLLGRVTYEGFAEAWPKQQGDPQGYGKRMNSIPKYVVSRTMRKLAWANSKPVKGGLVRGVSRLKEQPGNYMLVFGSLKLTNGLIERGLVDELTLWVFPIFLGRGRKIFTKLSDSKPKLIEARPFASGTVLMRYRF